MSENWQSHEASPNVIRVGLIGFGAVGGGLGKLIRSGTLGPIEVVGVVVSDVAKHAADEAETGWRFHEAIGPILDLTPDLVVEAGGHDAVRQHVGGCLQAGVDVMISGVGALEDGQLREQLMAAAQVGHARLRLSSGGIAGLDGIAAARLVGLERVIHLVRKPPEALLDPTASQHVRRTGRPKELYAGRAREAVRRYPQNVNVVAAVSLVGLGFDRTEVRIVADPSVERNTHEVIATGAFGRLTVIMENVPTDENPKTGRIVVGALARGLVEFRSPLIFGPW